MNVHLRNLLSACALASLAACGVDVKNNGNYSGSALGKNQQAVTGGICPGSATVQGIDVSEFQGGVNWGAVKGAGIGFAVARVSDGAGYIDPYFDSNWSGMKGAGLIRGAYQFFEPSQDAVAQANVVIARVGRLGPGDLPVMLDVEVTGGQSPGTITAKIHQWVDAIQAGTGKTPYIYSGAYFWDGNVGSADFAGLALNVAWYGTNCPGVPNAWAGPGWTFHQYADNGSIPGIGGAVDVDVFNGSFQALQNFAGGGYSVGGAIGALWNSLGGASGFLGEPTSDELPCADGQGRYQEFQGGVIYWRSDVGAHAVDGAIRGEWAMLHWEQGVLGYPTTNETGTPDGVGRYNHFQNGSIYWTPSTGAHAVILGIHAKWAALGWEQGALGYPTTDETGTPDGVGRYNHFQNGSIYWTPSTGAHAVIRGIHAKWAALGWEQGALGYPTTDETGTPDGVGRFNHFQHGSIYWTPSTGPHAVVLGIHDKWAAMGWERSVLGYPTTDESATACAGGRFNNFEHGAILWSAATGAHDSYGDIRNYWASTKFECGPWGLPTGDITATACSSGQTGAFQGGTVAWTKTTSAHGVPTAVATVWTKSGGACGVLGFPTDEAKTVGAQGQHQSFASGAISGLPATGLHAVYGSIYTAWVAAGGETGSLGFPIADAEGSGTALTQKFEHGTLPSASVSGGSGGTGSSGGAAASGAGSSTSMSAVKGCSAGGVGPLWVAFLALLPLARRRSRSA